MGGVRFPTGRKALKMTTRIEAIGESIRLAQEASKTSKNYSPGQRSLSPRGEFYQDMAETIEGLNVQTDHILNDSGQFVQRAISLQIDLELEVASGRIHK